MTLSTPYLIYIIAAYSLTLFGLGVFLVRTFYQWKKSKRLVNET